MKKSHVVAFALGVILVSLVAIDRINYNGKYTKALFSHKEPIPSVVYLKSYNELEVQCIQVEFYKPVTSTEDDNIIAYAIGEVPAEYCDSNRYPKNRIAHQVSTSDIKLSELH